MNALSTYFGASYLINLPERADRLLHATNELTRAGWVLGETGVQVFPAMRFSDSAGFPGIGVRGAFYSHWECLRLAQAEGRKSVLILEDDIALSPALTQVTPTLVSRLDAGDWDIVYFGHEGTDGIARASSDTTRENFSLQPWDGEIYGLHFYAVSGRALPRIIAHLDRVSKGTPGDQEYGPMPVDGALNVFRRATPDIRTLVAAPKLGWQRPSRSDITPQKFDDIRPLRPLTNALRDFKYLVNRWRMR